MELINCFLILLKIVNCTKSNNTSIEPPRSDKARIDKIMPNPALFIVFTNISYKDVISFRRNHLKFIPCSTQVNKYQESSKWLIKPTTIHVNPYYGKHIICKQSCPIKTIKDEFFEGVYVSWKGLTFPFSCEMR